MKIYNSLFLIYRRIIWTLALAVFYLLFPISIHAFSADLMIDTGNISINALEATIGIPQDIEVEGINDGNSVLLFWIESPAYDAKSRSISFSGITPGGFQGRQRVFSVSGNFTAEDLSRPTFSNVRALKNDGTGTSVSVTLVFDKGEIIEDTDPPEDFKPLIGRNDDIFDGKYFLVFTTQDKGIGIGHYEVKEGYLGNFIRADSPYLLKHQSLNKKIFVRVFDKSGNERTVTLGATHPNKWNQYALFVIMLGILVFILFVKRIWLKSKN